MVPPPPEYFVGLCRQQTAGNPHWLASGVGCNPPTICHHQQCPSGACAVAVSLVNGRASLGCASYATRGLRLGSQRDERGGWVVLVACLQLHVCRLSKGEKGMSIMLNLLHVGSCQPAPIVIVLRAPAPVQLAPPVCPPVHHHAVLYCCSPWADSLTVGQKKEQEICHMSFLSFFSEPHM